MSKKYRIRHNSDEILEELKRRHIIHIKGTLISTTVRELEGKPLTKIRRSENSEEHVWVRDETTGKEHEVREDLLEPSEE